jgi:hypothetical protein
LPLLDVLLCTMGTLIVVLGVVNREARLHPTKRLSGKAAAAMAHAQELKEASEDWELQIDQLSAAREKTQGDLENSQTRLAGIEEHSRQLQDQLLKLCADAKALRDNDDTDKRRDAIRNEIADLNRRRMQLDGAIKNARAQAGNQKPVYAVVPFEGTYHTGRRPIYIECRGDGVVLQPEGIVFGPDDLLGPGGPANPLAVAIRAAQEYWRYAPTNDGLPNEPYPLLLVRPDGIEAYLAARMAMSSCNAEFGYELIPYDWKLDFPFKPDDKLKETETRAVTEARDRLQWLAQSSPERFNRRPKTEYRLPARGGSLVRDGGPALARDPFNEEEGRGFGKRPDGQNQTIPGTFANSGPSQSGSVRSHSGSDGNAAAVGSGVDGNGDRAYGGPDGVSAFAGGTGQGDSAFGTGGVSNGTSAFAGRGPGQANFGSPGGSPFADGANGGPSLNMGGNPNSNGGPNSSVSGTGSGADGTGFLGSGSGSPGSNPNIADVGPRYSGSGADSPTGVSGGDFAKSNQYSGGQPRGRPGDGRAGGRPSTSEYGGVAWPNSSGGGKDNFDPSAPAGNGQSSDDSGQYAGGGSSFNDTSSSSGMSGGSPSGSLNGSYRGSPGGRGGSSSSKSGSGNGDSASGNGSYSGMSSSSSGSSGSILGTSDSMMDSPTGGVPSLMGNPLSQQPNPLTFDRGKNWALPTGGSSASIPLTRPIRIECYPDRLVLLPDTRDQQPQVIPLPDRTDAAVDQLVTAVRGYTKTWGMAGRSMYWKPQLVLEVKPSAERRAADLQALLANSGLDITRR